MTDPTADERVRAARRFLLRLAADGSDPRWSSRMLEDLLDATMRTPGGEVRDVMRALFELSAGDGGELTPARAHLVQDLVAQASAQFRDSLTRGDVAWARSAAGAGLTPAQAYLLLHALPEAELRRLQAPILAALEGGSYAEEAHREFGDAESDLR